MCHESHTIHLALHLSLFLRIRNLEMFLVCNCQSLERQNTFAAHFLVCSFKVLFFISIYFFLSIIFVQIGKVYNFFPGLMSSASFHTSCTPMSCSSSYFSTPNTGYSNKICRTISSWPGSQIHDGFSRDFNITKGAKKQPRRRFRQHLVKKRKTNYSTPVNISLINVTKLGVSSTGFDVAMYR